MLLPKRPNANKLSDYMPFSLIHLVAKIFAKLLSLCLAPKLALPRSQAGQHRQPCPECFLS